MKTNMGNIWTIYHRRPNKFDTPTPGQNIGTTRTSPGPGIHGLNRPKSEIPWTEGRTGKDRFNSVYGVLWRPVNELFQNNLNIHVCTCQYSAIWS